MATGSDAAVLLRQHILPDQENGAGTHPIRTFIELGRDRLVVLRFSPVGMKALELRDYRFPHTLDDTAWAQRIGLLLAQEQIGLPAAVAVDNVPCSLVPNDLNSEGMAGALLRLEHGGHGSGRTVSGLIDPWDVQCVAIVPKALSDALPPCPTLPMLCGWAKAIVGHPAGGITAHLLTEGGGLRLAVTEGRALLLHNVFGPAAASDVLYYVLAVLEQLGVLYTDASVALWGDATKDDETFALLGRYFTRVGFGGRPQGLGYAYAFGKVPDHRYAALLSLPAIAP